MDAALQQLEAAQRHMHTLLAAPDGQAQQQQPDVPSVGAAAAGFVQSVATIQQALRRFGAAGPSSQRQALEQVGVWLVWLRAAFSCCSLRTRVRPCPTLLLSPLLAHPCQEVHALQLELHRAVSAACRCSSIHAHTGREC